MMTKARTRHTPPETLSSFFVAPFWKKDRALIGLFVASNQTKVASGVRLDIALARDRIITFAGANSVCNIRHEVLIGDEDKIAKRSDDLLHRTIP